MKQNKNKRKAAKNSCLFKTKTESKDLCTHKLPKLKIKIGVISPEVYTQQNMQ